ncbi:MAG: Wzz/FepE/Etk N-terminal domain-containing protein, partial [Desulfobacterales bacterium]|nr:Wzz/FepE/Etk N-terminal domain-containing protein [Desulfobacterales bacterium]
MERQIQEKEIHISDYLMVLVKQRAVILAVTTAFLILGVAFTFLSEPVYQSSAKVIIDKENSASPITGERTDYENYVSQTMTFNTHFKLIKSQPVIERLIHSLDLEEVYEELEIHPVRALVKVMKENLLRVVGVPEAPVSRQEEWQALVEMLQEKICIQQVRDTRLLTIRVKDRNPGLAADIANALARNYIEFNLANKMDASKQTLEWMNAELFGLRKKLEAAEKAFFDYKQQNRVFSITGKQKMAEQKIVEFNNKYLEARNRRLELDARIAELGRHIQGEEDIAMVRSLVDNPMI